MSQILEDLRNGVIQDKSRLYQYSFKAKAQQKAAIEATKDLLPKNSADSEVIRFLIDLGWEAIENDGIFLEVIDKKSEYEQFLKENDDFE